MSESFDVVCYCNSTALRFSKLIFLPLFTELFHKDVSLLIRMNYSYFIHKNELILALSINSEA